jgi:hypothetical protein
MEDVSSMAGFKRIPELGQLCSAYPDASSLRDASIKGGMESRVAIARLWLSEGIPFAFRDCPDIYESMRTWLAGVLNVDANEISMTGSGRIGQSLHPDKIGKLFSKTSDLDLFVVSEKLFDDMRKDALAWCSDYQSGNIKPKYHGEDTYWPENVYRIPININRGFVDSNKIPARYKYTKIAEIANAMSRLKSTLDQTSGAPVIRKSSVRCYKSWQEFVNQVSSSLPK